MAAALTRRRIAEMGLSDQVDVRSAGVRARTGDKACEGAATVLASRDISLGEHLSRPMTDKLLQQADIVLVMEEAHRRSLFYLNPGHLRKVFLLTEMAGGNDNIVDPYGGPLEGYIRTADQLDDLITTGLPKILQRIDVAPQAAEGK
jgi:protein-tyrosine-phosphatase